LYTGRFGKGTNIAAEKQLQPLPGRLASVDALRGFNMFWIIGGGHIFTSLHPIFKHPVTAWINKQLSHVPWEGFRFEDLIMPLFLFIVGVVMPFSFGKRLAAGQSKRRFYGHIFFRAALLFVLGMVAQGHLLEYDLSKLHIYCNTLQAIAAGYLISAMIILHQRLRGQIIITVVLLLAFWALMMLVPVPGHGKGDLSPDGNLAIYIDKLVLGRFQDGTSYTWILSSMTFACTVMLGTFGGQLLRSGYSPIKKVLFLTGLGIGCIVLGLLWAVWFPIIKHLWTSSFVLYSAGLCYLLLAGFYLLIDVWNLRKWAFPLIVIGTNAIAVYMATRLFDFRHIGDIFVRGLQRHVGSAYDLVRALAGFIVLWLILFWMYRKRTFVKI